MKRIIITLLLTLSSTFSYSDDTCSINNDSLSIAEAGQCVSEELKNDEFLRQATMFVGEERYAAITEVMKDITPIDITNSDQIPLGNKYSILDSIQNLNQFYVGIFFAVIALATLAFMIWRGMTSGSFIDKQAAPFSLVIFGLAIAVNSGAFLFVTQFILIFSIVISLMLAAWCVFPMFVSMILDNKLLQQDLKEDADEFAKALVTSQIEQHTNDLIARKMVAVESGLVEFAGKKIKIDADDYVSCLVSHVQSDKVNYKLYVAPSIRNSIYCSNEELDWSVYKVGSILDEKANNVSLPIVKEIHANESVIRNLALTRIKNHCNMIFRGTEDKSGRYQTFCMNQDPNGYIENENGYAGTYSTGEVLSDVKLKAEEKKLVDRISSVAYIEMLKAANTKVTADDIKKLSFSSRMKIISLGSEYKAAYLAAGHEVIDLKINDEVLIKKNKLQYGYNDVKNLKIFKGYGSVDLYGFANYVDSLNDVASVDQIALNILKTISGDSVTKMGVQYKDCIVKGTCNTPSYNPFYPILDATKKISAFIAFMYAGSTALAHHYKIQADEMLGKDPYLNAKAHNQNSISDALFGMMIAILIGIFTVILVFVLFYLYQIFQTFAMFFQFPWSFGMGIIVNAWHAMRKEDTVSFNELLRRFGFYDMATRLPLLVLSSAIGIIVLNIMLFLGAIVLQGIFLSNMAFFENGGLVMSVTAGLSYLVMYFGSFLVSLIVIMKTCNSEFLKLTRDLNYSAQDQSRVGQESMDKVKSILSKV